MEQHHRSAAEKSVTGGTPCTHTTKGNRCIQETKLKLQLNPLNPQAADFERTSRMELQCFECMSAYHQNTSTSSMADVVAARPDNT